MSNFVPIALVVEVLAVLGIHGGVERASVNGRDWRTLIEQDSHPDPRLTRLEHCELRARGGINLLARGRDDKMDDILGRIIPSPEPVLPPARSRN